MTDERYTERQKQIIRGEIPDDQIITAEYTRILKYAKEVGDIDVTEKIQPFRDARKPNYHYINKFTASHYDRVNFFVPKGFRQYLKDYADQHGVSMNSLIQSAVFEKVGYNPEKQA